MVETGFQFDDKIDQINRTGTLPNEVALFKSIPCKLFSNYYLEKNHL